MRMGWEQLLFLHWKWDAAEIQRGLPAGLIVDVFEGQAWLGIVPFFMRKVRPPISPWGLGFLELNVRTYVCDGRGVPGVWFYSLACNFPPAVWAARRFFHLNYVSAQMSAWRADDGHIRYRMRRADAPEALFAYRPEGRFAMPPEGSLEQFLFERYVLFSVDRRGRLYSGQVFHRPYEVGGAGLSEWSFAPAEADGFAAADRPPDHVATARDLDVLAWPIVRVDAAQ